MPESLNKNPHQIFTPDQMPLQSPNTQSLIKHNEDLAARLSVSLKRIGHMEKVIEDIKVRCQAENANAEALRDEVMIVSEKFRLSEQQLLKITSDLTRKNQRLERYKIDHEALRDETRRQKAEVDSQINPLKTQIEDLLIIKKIAEEKLKPQIYKFKKLSSKQLENITHLSSQNNSLEEKIYNLRVDKDRMATEFEDKIKSLIIEHKRMLEKIDQQKASQEQLSGNLKKALKEKVYWENKFLDLEGQAKTSQTKSQKHILELEHLQKEQLNEIQNLKIDNYELKKSWSESHHKVSRLQEKMTSIKEQGRSLKNMWQEKTSQVSDLEVQVKTHETMRHELTLKINFF